MTETRAGNTRLAARAGAASASGTGRAAEFERLYRTNVDAGQG